MEHGMSDSAAFVQRLRTFLQDLHGNPYPQIPTSPCCQRGVVSALVLRIRPTFPSLEAGASRPNQSATPSFEHTPSFEQCLDGFFDQDWVQNGDPEVLFIKDRRNGRLGLPHMENFSKVGDNAASIRNTGEEIGLNLDADHCISIGSLPERVYGANWGTIPVFRVCTFVFLLRRHEISPPTLQPTRIQSTHWVSIRDLLSPALRSTKRVDVSHTLVPRNGPFIEALMKPTISQVVLTSFRLTPLESSYCSSAPSPTPTPGTPKNIVSRSAERLGLGSPSWQQKVPSAVEDPYLLWGLGLSFVTDLLDHIDPRPTSTLWSWPTFSHWDTRAILWLITYGIRMRESTTEMTQDSGGFNSRSKNLAPKSKRPMDDANCIVQGWRLNQATAYIPNEYYRLMRKAVVYAFILRAGAVAVLAAVAIARYYYARF